MTGYTLLAKSWLLRMPPAYEAVQRFRDAAWLRRAVKNGSYAQHGEDSVLLKLLVDARLKGPYVDVGANHPFRLSNTYLLYQNGWRGLCIDPLPRYRGMHRRLRPLDEFQSVAIGTQSGELTLFEFESDVLATLDEHIAAQYQTMGHRLRRRILVPVHPLTKLLVAMNIKEPISLLSVDVEGHELEVLQSLDFDRFRPGFICLETHAADGSRTDAVDYVKSQGYQAVFENQLNIVLGGR